MGSFRKIPIQRKLRVVILATCTAALVVACGALFALQFYFFRRDFIRDLYALSQIIGNNSTAALSFHDGDAAHEILGTLRAKPHVTGAALILRDGTILAETGEALVPDLSRTTPPPGLQMAMGDWIFVHRINLDGEHLGTLVLRPGYRKEANELIRVHAAILVAVLGISFLVAVLISWRLERLILYPIRSLAETARTISRLNDYSVRAEKFVDDELGSFTDSFNRMLNQIQSRDRALRHEIAERKRAEEKLQKMQEQIMDASRQAGMADIATGVLHNVGNVLNSVNVSATLIAEKLHHSRIGNLLRASQLIRERNDDLARFLVEDPKGRILPGYIIDVSDHLAGERADALAELSLLTRNIEHIKEIVARQQNYACVSALTEILPLDELIEDAVRMKADAFKRHGIVVDWSCSEPLFAAVDRHQVLQILINILRNAKNALLDSGNAEKRITIRLECHETDWARIRIADTGIGIERQNLTKVFSHGFTTRKEGHGFGLHTAALAVRQMGGSISAQSDGPGLGAVFILDFPSVQPSYPVPPAPPVAAV